MKKKGFTLIELLVVCAIIAMLATMVIIAVKKMTIKSRDTRRKADLQEIQAALEKYSNDHNGYFPVFEGGSDDHDISSYPNFLAAIQPYLDPIPNDPLWHKGVRDDLVNNEDCYCYRYFSHGYDYHLYANLENGSECEVNDSSDVCQ